MRNVIVAPVGDDGREIGQLQRRTAQRILTDSQRNDGQRIPRTPVLAVVVRAVGHVAVALVEEVGAEFAAEAETLDILFPDVVTVFHALVFTVVENVAEDIAEIGVARSRHGEAQVQRRSVGVAFHAPAADLITFVADVQVRGFEHALLQTDQALHEFEGRSRRVFCFHGTAEKRVPLVVDHLHIVIAALPADQFVGIVRRRGDHHQDFARSGFDRHGRSDLAAHQFLAQQLQAGVDRADKIFSRFGQRVVNAVHIGAFDRSVGVDLLNLHAFLAFQQRFVGRLHAAHTHVIAGLVIRVAFEKIGVHLAHESQQVAAHLAGITADRTVNGIESPEVAFVETQLVLLGDIARHHAGRTGTHPGVGEFLFEFFARESQHLAHAQGIESLFVDLAVYHHQVVTLAALDQILPVTVEDFAARRILHHMAQHVGFGQFAVARVEKLDIGQTAADQQEDEKHHALQGAHPDESFGISHTRTGSFAVKMRAMIQIKATDTAPLATMRTSVRTMCIHERASSEKNTAWCRSTSTIR